MIGVLVLAILMSAGGKILAEESLEHARKPSLEIGKLRKLIEQKKFSKAADQVNKFQQRGGDFEQVLPELAERLLAWEAPALDGLLKEFARRQQWSNAHRVAAAWESALNRTWKDFPDLRDSLKMHVQSSVGHLYLQQGDLQSARQAFEDLMQAMRSLPFAGCGLNKDFLSHFQSRWEGPRLIHHTLPRYTSRAIQEQIQGAVLMVGIVEENGKISNIGLVRGLGYGLDDEARAAMENWTLEPARFQQVPVRCLASFEVTFTLSGASLWRD